MHKITDIRRNRLPNGDSPLDPELVGLLRAAIRLINNPDHGVIIKKVAELVSKEEKARTLLVLATQHRGARGAMARRSALSPQRALEK